MTLPSRGLSSSSSSLEDWCEFCELIRGADEDLRCYSDATHEVSRLQHYLEAIRVALEASERETIAMQAAAIDVQARVVGKDAFVSCCLTHHLSFLISF